MRSTYIKKLVEVYQCYARLAYAVYLNDIVNHHEWTCDIKIACSANSEDSDVEVDNQRNHRNRVDGPWVFGLKVGNDWRYFWVERCDQATLIFIIEHECAVGSVIHSDEWPSFRCLESKGYEHDTVNHRHNFVNPDSGAHTQGIERSWLDAKIKLKKQMRGVPKQHFQSHLDHVCWRALRHSEPDLFVAFLRDIRTVYRVRVQLICYKLDKTYQLQTSKALTKLICCPI